MEAVIKLFDQSAELAGNYSNLMKALLAYLNLPNPDERLKLMLKEFIV